MTDAPKSSEVHVLTFKGAPYGYGRCERCGALLNVLTMTQTPCPGPKEPTR